MRFRWQGQRYARTTALCGHCREPGQLQKLANLIAATIAAGKDPLALLEPKTAEARAPKPRSGDGARVLHILDRGQGAADGAQGASARLPPPRRRIRPGAARGHALAELSPRDILGLRAQLLQRGLSLKYVKNILGGSFKAMIRDAREIDRVLMLDPFVGVRWGRVPVPGPEPFTAEERSRILTWFKKEGKLNSKNRNSRRALFPSSVSPRIARQLTTR